MLIIMWLLSVQNSHFKYQHFMSHFFMYDKGDKNSFTN
jgi:hypothetical protein